MPESKMRHSGPDGFVHCQVPCPENKFPRPNQWQRSLKKVLASSYHGIHAANRGCWPEDAFPLALLLLGADHSGDKRIEGSPLGEEPLFEPVKVGPVDVLSSIGPKCTGLTPESQARGFVDATCCQRCVAFLC